jgi:hypothetical protein
MDLAGLPDAAFMTWLIGVPLSFVGAVIGSFVVAQRMK